MFFFSFSFSFFFCSLFASELYPHPARRCVMCDVFSFTSSVLLSLSPFYPFSPASSIEVVLSLQESIPDSSPPISSSPCSPVILVHLTALPHPLPCCCFLVADLPSVQIPFNSPQRYYFKLTIITILYHLSPIHFPSHVLITAHPTMHTERASCDNTNIRTKRPSVWKSLRHRPSRRPGCVPTPRRPTRLEHPDPLPNSTRRLGRPRRLRPRRPYLSACLRRYM